MRYSVENFQSIPIGNSVWFRTLRFFMPLLLIGSGLVFLRASSFNYSLLFVYALIAVSALIAALSAGAASGIFIRSLMIALIACELLIESLLVNHVGGNFSPFIMFFILTIVTASLIFHLVGALIVATLAGLLYSLPILFNLSFIYEGLIEPPRLAGMGISSDEAFYTVFLHLCLFYLSAFISGYLAENLSKASRELSKIRLETGEILEQMHSGLMTVDDLGRIIYFNRAGGEILGLDHIQAKGKLPVEFFHVGLEEFKQKIEHSFARGLSESRAEIAIRHPQRGIIPLGLSSSVLKDDTGRPRGVIAVFQDLTEAKKMEAHLRASDRLAAVGRLAAGIAHEIRNPLASISGSVEVLKDGLKLDGDDLRLLELILRESSRLNTILTDFLNYARVSKIGVGKCDLAAVIAETVTLASTHHQVGAAIEIAYSLHQPVIMVAGSEDQFKQVLWNLILNAAQAIGERDGKIVISTHSVNTGDDNRFVQLKIADTGPGIPANTREKIFEPFFSTKDGGTGLGLPIVARIVDCLGGRIELETSEAWPTIFVISLPPEPSMIKADKSLAQQDNILKDPVNIH